MSSFCVGESFRASTWAISTKPILSEINADVLGFGLLPVFHLSRGIISRWIPSHTSLTGSEKADHPAKHKPESGKQAERWSSCAAIGDRTKMTARIGCQEWTQLKFTYVYPEESDARTIPRTDQVAQDKDTERENSRRSYYIPRTKEAINPTLVNAPKKYASQYYQLKVGHGAIGTYFTQIGVYRVSRMLVMQRYRAICWALIHQMSQIEKRKEEASQRTRERRNQVAGSRPIGDG